MDTVSSSLYEGYRYPVEMISHCVWLYPRFPLSLREVEEMMMMALGADTRHHAGHPNNLAMPGRPCSKGRQ